ncbi:hypothetical protein [Candidatus Leptofilum sp.]|uniref:hypothetical protein n=1 Tax=Candidatus Leptofilum sp. TaxID=3241576 RepID=UPI003B5A3FD4
MTTITLEVPEHLAQTLKGIGDQLPLVLELGVSRFAPLSTKAYVEAITFLTQEPSPSQLATFRFSDDVEKRISELLEKGRNDQLSKAEEVELERLSLLEEQLQLVKANALTKLSSSKSS